MAATGRVYGKEQRKNEDGSFYWIAIDSTRRLVLNNQGRFVNLYSVDSYNAVFGSEGELDAAIKLYEASKLQGW